MQSEFYDNTQTKLSMLFEDKRLETFKSWKFDDTKNCSALKLAEAGFYYIGTAKEPDAVMCFFCDKELDGWDENDDPLEEHLSHSLKCKFAKLKQSEIALGVQQMYDLHSELINKRVEEAAEKIITAVGSEHSKNCLKIKRTLRNLKKI